MPEDFFWSHCSYCYFLLYNVQSLNKIRWSFFKVNTYFKRSFQLSSPSTSPSTSWWLFFNICSRSVWCRVHQNTNKQKLQQIKGHLKKEDVSKFQYFQMKQYKSLINSFSVNKQSNYTCTFKFLFQRQRILNTEERQSFHRP